MFQIFEIDACAKISVGTLAILFRSGRGKRQPNFLVDPHVEINLGPDLLRLSKRGRREECDKDYANQRNPDRAFRFFIP